MSYEGRSNKQRGSSRCSRVLFQGTARRQNSVVIGDSWRVGESRPFLVH